MRCLFGIYFLTVMFMLIGCAAKFSETDKSPKGLFMRGEQALKEHRFNEAHYAFSEMVGKYPKDENADDALYKKGYLEVYLNKFADAETSFSKLMSGYADSKWRFDASLWQGLLGEYLACKNVISRSVAAKKDKKECEEQFQLLETENTELRRQIQMLRELLEE